MYRTTAAFAIVACLATSPVAAATPREALVKAAFATNDKASALAQIDAVARDTAAVLQKQPTNHEALLIHAMATGYQAKLTRNRTAALAAKAMFEALAARDPRDAEAQAAIGSWHVDAVTKLGGFLARTALGASKATGLAALDRAVALGGNRALFPGIAALLRLQLDAADARGAALAEAATHGATPTSLDVQIQRSAALVLKRLREGQGSSIPALAKQLMPLGRFG